MASRPFQFWEKKRSKIRKRAAKNFEGLAALSIHSAERRTAVKAGCKPVHFGLDGCPLSCYFSGNVATLRDTLSTSRGVGRGAGAFIYALSADETSPALAAPRRAITVLFSCCFKCPCPTRRQPHFRSNADRAYMKAPVPRPTPDFGTKCPELVDTLTKSKQIFLSKLEWAGKPF